MGLSQTMRQLFAPEKQDATPAVLDQIEELMAAVNRANDGDYTEKITVSGDDAVGGLADGLQALLVEAAYTKAQLADMQAQQDALQRSQAIIEFNVDGEILYANDNFLNTMGYTLEGVKGQHHRIFVDSAYAASPEYRQFWQDLARGEFKEAEYLRYRKDGSPIWIRATYNPVVDAQGKPYKIVKFASDITDTKKEAVRVTQVDAMVKQATAMVFADEQFVVRFMNPAALKTLRNLEQYLPVKADEIVGQSIDVFHKNPQHQRRLLADPSNLPLTTQITVGPETLDLEVKAVYDDNQNRLGSMVTWEIVTEKLEMERKINQIQAMVQQASAMVFADQDFVVRFMNPAALKTLRSLEQHLPVKADEIVGQSIDVFHKNPHHQRGILADPSNLPLTTQISVGPEKLDLEVKAVYDDNQNRLGSMVTWEIVTKKLEMERQIKETAEEERRVAEETQKKVDVILGLVNSVADGDFDLDIPNLGNDAIGQVAEALDKAIGAIRSALTEVKDVSSTVATASTEMSSAAEEISKGAQQQAARLEETASSLEEITSTVKQNSDNAQEARQLANSSRDVATAGGTVVSDAVKAMSEINDASKKIADIITTIDEIAFQTNLLALNAAVEAARAGEQGRGFAVVAAEVRSLAQRSASSAKEIKSLIQDSNRKVENGTELVNKSGDTLNEIVESVKRVTDIVAEIAAASQEQLIGIEQVNRAVTSMDHVTQANASQTEELAGTSAAVLNNARRLETMVSAFQLGHENHATSDSDRRAAPAPPAAPIDPFSSMSGEATNPDDFIEF